MGESVAQERNHESGLNQDVVGGNRNEKEVEEIGWKTDTTEPSNNSTHRPS